MIAIVVLILMTAIWIALWRLARPDEPVPEQALRQLLDESQTQIDLAVKRKQEKATAMLFAARTKEICLKGLGAKWSE
jgi:hypothetical protein